MAGPSAVAARQRSEVLPDLDFWQGLLAAEMPHNRARSTVREVGSGGPLTLERLFRSPHLTPGERARIQSVDFSKLRPESLREVHILHGTDLPPALALEDTSPPGLFVWGDAEVLRSPMIAIVGTRNASTYGKAVTQKFAEALARAGLVVVSGGALGIDAAAHRGALSAGSPTVAVLANGVDYTYPMQHRGLFAEIRDKGCLLSQFALGSKPTRYRFVSRNYLIAALTVATVVIEAPERSGALITAHAAIEGGKPVFVVPANVDNIRFRGSHALIRDGATLVDSPDQVLMDLGMPTTLPPLREAPTLSPIQQRIADSLADEPLAPEVIVARTGLDAAEVLAELTILEVENVVIRDGGRYALRP